jgi:MFS family permease
MDFEHRVNLAQKWTYLMFFCFGFTYMNVIARLVGISDQLGISGLPHNARLTAWLLLFSSAGDIVGSLTGGVLVGRYSAKRISLVAGTMCGTSIIVISCLVMTGSYVACMFGFLMLGLSLGPLNIGMNMLAADIERYRGRELMLRFHSFFNLGAVMGSSISEVVVVLGLPMIVQHACAAGFVFFVMIMAKRRLFGFQISKGDEQREERHVPLKQKLRAVDSIVVMAGLIILSSEMIEGSGNNWVMKAVEESFHVGEARLIPILWVSLISALLTRYFGSYLAERLGKVNTIYLSFAIAVCGVAIICFMPMSELAYPGAVLWGGGIALSYPLTISIVAGQPRNAAFKTSIVSAIAGVFNIAAPPVMGEIGYHIGMRNALAILIPMGLIAFVFIAVLKKKLENALTPQ